MAIVVGTGATPFLVVSCNWLNRALTSCQVPAVGTRPATAWLGT